MESTQKKLLITGCILLIILIVIGATYIHNQSKAITTIVGEEAIAIQTANSELKDYEGKKKGNIAVKMINEVIKYNKNYSKDGKNFIKVCSNDKRILAKIEDDNIKESLTKGMNEKSSGAHLEESLQKIKKAISTSQYFKIWFDYNDENGMIDIVHIDEI